MNECYIGKGPKDNYQVANLMPLYDQDLMVFSKGANCFSQE